ncbi:hypothetical protein [Kibdelosporangium aridum]|uniref:hypothetical protein n=1 Tax=Kibdelosporangium aridum TaxID=2030 RepID=UPI000F773070|nr:hypothetical protein [Kibdelosporangium aridum]
MRAEVIEDDVHVQSGGHTRADGTQEGQQLLLPVAPLHRADHWPVAISSAANRLVGQGTRRQPLRRGSTP